MNVKEVLAGIGGIVLMIVMFLVMIFIACLFIYGGALVSSVLLPWFSILTWLALALVILIFLPLAIPRTTRNFAAIAMFISSYIFGATLLMESLLLTLLIWGIPAIILGIMLGGIGVVPIAMLATMIEGMWWPFFEMLILLIMTYSTRIGALNLAQSLERVDYIEGEFHSGPSESD